MSKIYPFIQREFILDQKTILCNQVLNMFYAITNCHGWIKSDKDKVVVRLEPLQQHSRRSAQMQFCRKLTQLAVITPGGKALQIEVGNSPID